MTQKNATFNYVIRVYLRDMHQADHCALMYAVFEKSLF